MRQRQLILESNLVGVGFGPKETAGRFTSDLAVRVYVERKLPREKIPPTELVPAIIDGVVTDVIAIGRPRFHVRPAYPGIGISRVDGAQGSLGCVVRKRGENIPYILSACHVMALSSAAQAGDIILEPAGSEIAEGRLAVLADFERLRIDENSNAFDAAIARLDRRSDVVEAIPGIGAPRWPASDPTLFQSVRKQGVSTLHTLGIVVDADMDADIISGGEAFAFSGVALVVGAGGAFSKGGDSGALVVDAVTLRPVGLVIGGTARGTMISPLKRIFKHFDLEAGS
ncbi:hypothetical protein [Rhizobium leguminosarum]